MILILEIPLAAAVVSFWGRPLPRLTTFTSGDVGVAAAAAGAFLGGVFFVILLRCAGGGSSSGGGWNVIVSTGPATLTRLVLALAMAFGRVILGAVVVATAVVARV